jgi:hypothetical protein
MSFDIFFQTCNLSNETEEAISPFTGETMQMPVGECVTDDERNSLRKLLASAGASSPDEHGCYFSDGSRAEVFFGGLEDDPEFSGGMIALRGLSIELTRFMYSLADSGNLLILPAMEGNYAIVTSTANANRIASRWPDATVVNSPEELHMILSTGFDGWKQYRDQVIGDS